MRRIVTVLMLIMSLIGFGFATDSKAQQSERLSAKAEISFEKGKEKHTYSGCLKEKCSVNVGQNIMLHTIEDTSLGEYKGTKNFRRFIFWHRLAGRTSEKTFNIESGMDSISLRDGRPDLGSGNKTKLQNIYFSAGDTVPLVRSFYFGCRDAQDQMIKLKMIELKENSLIHQIILPDCMKDIVTINRGVEAYNS